MKKAIICDIDYVLLDSSTPIMMMTREFNRGILSDSECWDKFYNNLHLCKRNEWCYWLIEKLSKDEDLTVLFITGRDERARKDTEKFLNFTENVTYKLYMRPHGNLEPDMKVKHNILKSLVTDYDIVFALDDREDNCSVYQAFGITTFKVKSTETHI